MQNERLVRDIFSVRVLKVTQVQKQTFAIRMKWVKKERIFKVFLYLLLSIALVSNPPFLKMPCGVL